MVGYTQSLITMNIHTEDIEVPVAGRLKAEDSALQKIEYARILDQQNILLNTSFQYVFTKLLINEISKHTDPKILDIGCGKGIGNVWQYTELVKEHSNELWGLDPDDTLPDHQNLFTNYQNTILENANLPSDYFDVVYAVYVLEHIQTPTEFFQTINRILKPGGVFVFITPNTRALIGKVSRILGYLKADGFVLKFIRPGERDPHEHYPVVARCNTRDALTKVCDSAHLSSPDLAFFEFDGAQGYFPGIFHPLFRLLMSYRRFRGNPECLDTIIGKTYKK